MEETMNLPGLIPDPRPIVEQMHDYTHGEFFIASALPMPVWYTKSENLWKKYSLRDQDGSSSCVGQGTAKNLEVFTKQVMSALTTYARRTNAPSEGMWLQDAGRIIKKIGATTEAIAPSQKLNEAQMNVPITVNVESVIDAYITLPIDIDQIAQMIDKYGAVSMCFKSTYQEWRDVPKIIEGSSNFFGHCVCAVDYTLYNGEKALIIEDSWGKATSLGNGGQRVITETYLNARATGAMYFIPKVAPTGEKPKYQFNKNLGFGTLMSKDVKALQDCLKWEGIFPGSTASTGNFLQATRDAVIAFQERYVEECLTPAGLTKGTGFVGINTRAHLNKLYKL